MLTFRYFATISFLFLIFIFLQYRLWWGEGGLLDLFNLKKDLQQQQAENNKLKQRNEELLLQIDRFRHNDDAIEAKARNELGMIKKSETFYQIVK